MILENSPYGKVKVKNKNTKIITKSRKVITAGISIVRSKGMHGIDY